MHIKHLSAKFHNQDLPHEYHQQRCEEHFALAEFPECRVPAGKRLGIKQVPELQEYKHGEEYGVVVERYFVRWSIVEVEECADVAAERELGE